MAKEEERSSMVSMVEASDSSSITYPLQVNKRKRRENDIVPARFKGVVPQQNGNWGAQIYANHHRIWLGTFKSETDAAMAYDSAAIKLRSRDCHRNFPWTILTTEESRFQQRYTAETLLDMIKDGSYHSQLEEHLTAHSLILESKSYLSSSKTHREDALSYKKLFQKELTPSDVGKLNRLVIPKKYAIKYFPQISESEEDNSSEKGDVQLVFHDRAMREWKFRYCYWKSSQSFVFTRGWNRFVMERDLKANDTITFYLCELHIEFNGRREFFLIDVNGRDRTENGELQLELKFGPDRVYWPEKDEIEEEDSAQLTDDKKEKGVKLFGVFIN